MKALWNKSKKNNKGFSLVELIVVILIMAIIAVALAPQVMKWVGTSRENTDENNTAAIKSSVLTAVADYMQKEQIAKLKGGSTDAEVVATYYVYNNGLVTGTCKDTTEGADLAKCIKEVMGDDYPTVQDTSGGNSFKIEITKSGTVTVEKATYSAS